MLGRTNVGGGAGLNFKVVGGTAEPANPKENTIWVNTDAEITSWIFSPAQPETLSEGMVWITTDKSSLTPFNALKKNCIQVDPISAKQYVSGAWVDVEAKSYQGGAWVDWWNGQLYEIGNQFVNITGGWGIHDYVTDSRTLMAAEHDDALGMFFQAQNDYKVLLGTGNPIDLSDKTQIRVTGRMNVVFPYNGTTYGMYMELVKTKDISSSYAKMSMLVKGEFDYTLDVSNLDGEYYVIIWVFSNANINGYVTGVYVS